MCSVARNDHGHLYFSHYLASVNYSAISLQSATEGICICVNVGGGAKELHFQQAQIPLSLCLFFYFKKSDSILAWIVNIRLHRIPTTPKHNTALWCGCFDTGASWGHAYCLHFGIFLLIFSFIYCWWGGEEETKPDVHIRDFPNSNKSMKFCFFCSVK